MPSLEPDADAATVIELERRLLDPAVRARPELVAELLHPDFLEFGASGRVWDTESILAALAADPSIGDGTMADPEVAEVAPGVALLTFRIAGADRPSIRSSIWLRTPDGRWQLRFHQGTPQGGDETG